MISVDRVYQTVNAILNQHDAEKLTDTDFQLLANKAQIDVFESHFYDLKNAIASGEPGKGSDWGDMADNIRDKIQIFERQTALDVDPSQVSLYSFPDNYYRLTAVYKTTVGDPTKLLIIEEVSHSRVPYIINSPLTSPSVTKPIYVWGDNMIVVYPELDPLLFGVTISYIKTPDTVTWNAEVVNGIVRFTETGSQDFELHPSDFPELVAGILTYAGVVLKRAEIVQFAQGEDQQINQTQQ